MAQLFTIIHPKKTLIFNLMKLAVGQFHFCPSDDMELEVIKVHRTPPNDKGVCKDLIELKYLNAKREKQNLIVEQLFFIEEILNKGTFKATKVL